MGALTIVLGLGNPGETYRATRHNLGFRTLDRLAFRSDTRLVAQGDLRRDAWWAETTVSGEAVVLAKPRRYMNRSGGAALALCGRFGVSPTDLVVVHDDADLSLGRLRVRRGGATGGHNGLRSLVDALGSPDFVRIRLGVRGTARDGADLAQYVLEPFEDDEAPIADALAEAGADAVASFLENGLEATMNRFNGRDVGAETDPTRSA